MKKALKILGVCFGVALMVYLSQVAMAFADFKAHLKTYGDYEQLREAYHKKPDNQKNLIDDYYYH